MVGPWLSSNLTVRSRYRGSVSTSIVELRGRPSVSIGTIHSPYTSCMAILFFITGMVGFFTVFFFRTSLRGFLLGFPVVGVGGGGGDNGEDGELGDGELGDGELGDGDLGVVGVFGNGDKGCSYSSITRPCGVVVVLVVVVRVMVVEVEVVVLVAVVGVMAVLTQAIYQT